MYIKHRVITLRRQQIQTCNLRNTGPGSFSPCRVDNDVSLRLDSKVTKHQSAVTSNIVLQYYKYNGWINVCITLHCHDKVEVFFLI